MPIKRAGSAGSKKHPKFAPLTLDFTFKKAFASEQSKNLLIFLLNAFLAEKLKSPIEEVKIMSNELLGKTRHNRKAVFDIYCEDASGAKFIVEIQVGRQELFIRRTFFYLCMVISGLAKKGKTYDFNLPKLYSISFLEFDLDFGDGCSEIIQHLSVRNDRHPEISYDMLQMTFVILPRFNKLESECKTVVDKILFSLKNGHKLKGIPKSFLEKEFRQLFEIAEISNFSISELSKYEAAMINEYDYKASIDCAKKDGIKEGMEKGMEKGIGKGIVKGLLQAAKSMLKEGLDPALVARITELPKKQIMALKH